MRIDFLIKKSRQYLFLIMMILYLAYNAMHGDQGIVGGAVERYRQQKLAIELTKVKQERMRLEQKISMLSGKAIDVDLLDELARRQLPLIGKNQIIIAK